MKKQFIPNETTFRIQIPETTVYGFQGEGCYEETLEDHVMYSIVQPLREQYIQFEFTFHAFDVKDGFGMELRVDGSRLEGFSIVDRLEERLRSGVVVTQLQYGRWVVVHDDSRKSIRR
ncbi:MAG TPA: hypothetical protein VGD45_04855 [Steroidobacter sp.]|uniref:hypothetical protein n=1 Tax=Steroidobacter sp. TaxID=1978227 RepID=UPI002ED8CD74